MKLLRSLLLAVCILRQDCLGFFRRAHQNSKKVYSNPSGEFSKNGGTVNGKLSWEQSTAITIRGGACSDSTPALFGKVALSASLETFLMYQLLNYGVSLNASKSIQIKPIQAALVIVVIFGSAYFGQIIDTGMSTATRQVMAPNEIPGDADWYSNLKKPSWNPPGWLFPIMWLVISKPTQFVAVWKLMRDNSEKDLTLPLIVYCAHLSLGDAWNKVFFGLVSEMVFVLFYSVFNSDQHCLFI